jgi:hypothetical protein
MSTDPITDLQHEWIAIARGLDDHTSPEGSVPLLSHSLHPCVRVCVSYARR